MVYKKKKKRKKAGFLEVAAKKWQGLQDAFKGD